MKQAVQRAPKKAAATGAKPKQSRDPVRSKQAILEAANEEFYQHGFSGGRVESIAKNSKSNMRMIYHYFGDKEGLYLAVLEAAYLRLRSQESKLDLSLMTPPDAMRQLIKFTYDFFASNKDVLTLINNENTMKGRFLKQLPNVKNITLPLINAITSILKRGHRDGSFRGGVDPLQFYVSLVALSQLHILNRFTLSIIFDKDLTDSSWLKQRRSCVEDTLMAYLQDIAPSSAAPKAS